MYRSGLSLFVGADTLPRLDTEGSATDMIVTKYIVGMNEAGYLPDDETGEFDTWADAKQALIDQMVDTADAKNEMGEVWSDETGCENLRNAAEEVNLWTEFDREFVRTDHYSISVAAGFNADTMFEWWITKRIEIECDCAASRNENAECVCGEPAYDQAKNRPLEPIGFKQTLANLPHRTITPKAWFKPLHKMI